MQICSMGTVDKTFWTEIEILSTYFFWISDVKSVEKFDKHSKMAYHFKTHITLSGALTLKRAREKIRT